ncbi:hypothetical protein PQR66_03305 [Paraburkholderia agricolaris]|uniref:Uncharacterized protein n=1 Tax=Paraburkholderia agricolaris TaxID=2152888 RepID=A0ABW8ZHI8_9BURK
MNQTQQTQERGGKPQRAPLTEKDLGGVPDSVLRWMARHAKGNDLAVVGGALVARHFGTH